MTTAVSSATSTAASTLSSSSSGSEVTSDRFLKLLVAQMQNQDPLNPLDNAEVTSQMAQISTVESLSTLNSTVGGLNSSFAQMQALQGAALIGRNVAIEGNDLQVTDGVGQGGFELSSSADTVKIEILNAGGSVIDSFEMTGLEAGRHDFSHELPEAYKDSALTFQVTATSGTTEVSSMALAYHQISATSNFDGTLAFELDDGERITYDAIWAFL